MSIFALKSKKVFKDKSALEIATAIERNKPKSFEGLIERASDLNICGEGGVTLLHWAAYMKNKRAMKCLLDAGIDSSIWDDQLETAASLLTGAEDPELLKVLLVGGVNPNLRDGRGEPLLFQAIMHRRIPQLKLLIEREADVNIRYPANVGETAIFPASSIHEYEGLLLLFQSGADPDVKNESGETFRNYFKFWNEDILTGQALADRNRVKAWLLKNEIEFE